MTAMVIRKLIDSIDRSFYEEFDPFFHFSLICFLEDSSPSEITLESFDGEIVEQHDLIESIRRSQSKQADHVLSLGRVFRYFSSETLILMLLSGHPFGPFVRTSSVLRYEKLNAAFESISTRRIPKGYGLSVNGVELSFDEWISQRITFDSTYLNCMEGSEIVDLVVEEAELLVSRGPINAFKHGKPFSFGKSAALSFHNKDFNQVQAMGEIKGINWIDWRERDANRIQISFGAQEVCPSHDRERVLSVAMLLDAICKIRLAHIDGESNFDNVHFPIGVNSGLKVRQQSVTIRVNKDKGVVR